MSETTAIASAHPMAPACLVRPRLARAEQVTLGFFLYVTIAAFVFQLDPRDLILIMTLSGLTLATQIALNRNRHWRPWLAAVADFFPALVILVAYRETGLLVTPDTSQHLDYIFIQWDWRLLHNPLVEGVLQAGAPWLQHYLELAYLLCYPLVPLGAAAVCYAQMQGAAVAGSASGASPTSAWKGLRQHGQSVQRGFQGYIGGDAGAKMQQSMDDFWAVVLLATLFCYAVYPYFPLTPPRVLFADVPGPHVGPLLRQLNFWLLDHYSVQACIFPSGHVAAATAVALAVRKHSPRLGLLFLFLAASVTVATVYGRYHYAADAFAGAAVGFAAYNGLNFLTRERQIADSSHVSPQRDRAMEDRARLSPAIGRVCKSLFARPSKY
jgi:membrane-associated phospholipid phosphatase